MKKILSYIIIIGLFLVAGMKTAAIDARYKNNLLNVELSQTPDNRVSVLLVFEKPYTEPVKVIYKTDNEYNILLPETYHSITSVSTLNALNIRNASVKLVPYFNQDNSNGYTKIILQTTRPVVFNAHASYITTQIAQNDLIDKLEQDEEFKLTPTTVKVATNTVKTPAKTAVKKQSVKAKSTKTVVKPTVKTVAKQQPVKAVSKPVQPTTQVAKVTPPVNVDNSLLQNQTQEVNTIQEDKIVVAPKEDLSEVVNKKEDIKPVQENKNEAKQPQGIVFDINSIIQNTNVSLYMLLVALLLLIIMLRKVSKRNIKAQTNSMMQAQFEYAPETQDIPQEIKDLSWQEKYKFMKEQEEQNLPKVEDELVEQVVVDSVQETSDVNSGIEIEKEEPLAKVSFEEIAELNEKAIMSLNDGISANNEDVDPFGFNNPPVNEGFEPAVQKDDNQLEETEIEALNDISDIEPSVDLLYEVAPDKEEIEEVPLDIEINETKISNPLEPTLLNQTKISKTKGFYLVRYENEVALMGYINEQIFLLHSFDNKQPTFIQTRLTEKKKGSEVYMVRAENFKSLIKVTKDNMQTLINL